MRIEEVSTYAHDYSRSQVNRIVPELNRSQALTLFSPSGFGKTKLLKYLSYNRKYRKSFPSMKNIELVYIDLIEFTSDIGVETPLSTINLAENWKQKKLVTMIIKKFISLRLNTTDHEAIEREYLSIINNEDPKTSLWIYLDKLFASNSKLFIYIVLDNVESLLKDEFNDSKEFLRYLRDKYKSRLELFFVVQNLSIIEHINAQVWGAFKDLMSQRIMFMIPPLLSESVWVDVTLPANPILKFLAKRKPEFTQRMQVINYLSGGYPAYIKYLGSLTDEELKHLKLRWELELSSERLLQSFTPTYINLLTNIAQGKEINRGSKELFLLKHLGIVEEEQGQLKIFSAILKAYLLGNIEE